MLGGRAKCQKRKTNHYTKEIPLRDLSLGILIDLHQPLGIRPNWDDHPTRTRELLHKRRRNSSCRRSNMNGVIWALLGVPYNNKNTSLDHIRFGALRGRKEVVVEVEEEEEEELNAPSRPSPVTSTIPPCSSITLPSPSARRFFSASAVSAGMCSMPTTALVLPPPPSCCACACCVSRTRW
jgi:hypothetical protein